MQRHRHFAHVRQLERDHPLEPGVDEARRRVNHNRQPPDTGAAVHAAHQIVREFHALLRRTEHELAGVEDERLAVRHVVHLRVRGRVVHAGVDVGLVRVPEQDEPVAQPQIHGARLDLQLGVLQRLDHDPPRLESGANVPIG